MARAGFLSRVGLLRLGVGLRSVLMPERFTFVAFFVPAVAFFPPLVALVAFLAIAIPSFVSVQSLWSILFDAFLLAEMEGLMTSSST